jgi:hypothetical protein
VCPIRTTSNSATVLLSVELLDGFEKIRGLTYLQVILILQSHQFYFFFFAGTVTNIRHANHVLEIQQRLPITSGGNVPDEVIRKQEVVQG